MTKTTAPERIEYLLPQEAASVDKTQRQFLDYLHSYGYQIVVPPLAEGIDDLLAGADGSLGKLTLRLTDPLGGKPIGIRADITPQIRRIDATHFADHVAVNRLCYCGPTLYSRPIKPWLNRERQQAGAEIFGGDPVAAITEIVMLAVESMTELGVKDLFIALGHAGLAEGLLENVPQATAQEIRQYLAKRDLKSIATVCEDLDVPVEQFAALTKLAADAAQLSDIEAELGDLSATAPAMQQLRDLGQLLTTAGVAHCFDLATLTGFDYHNGVTFAVLSGETTISRGGSYGSSTRQAAGFSLDLRNLSALLPAPDTLASFASLRNFNDAAWRDKVTELRATGHCCVLVDDWDQVPADCSQRLVADKDNWTLEKS